MPNKITYPDTAEYIEHDLLHLASLADDLETHNFPQSAETLRLHISQIWNALFGNLSPRPKELT